MGRSSPGGHGHGEEVLVYQRPGQGDQGDVGHAQHRLQTQLGFHPMKGLQSLGSGRLLGGDREGEAVDIHVLSPDAKGHSPLQNAFGHLKAGLGGLGNAVLIQSEAHHRRAVLLHQGQDGLQRGALSVHRVDDGLAAVDPQGLLQHLGVGGIQLERSVGDSLEGLDGTHHHVRLVDLRQAHVHIQNVGSRLGLSQSLAQHIVYIAPPEGLLHQLLAGGVDALADDPHPVNGHRLGGAAHSGGDVAGHVLHRLARQLLGQQGDILRRGAAAATERPLHLVRPGRQGSGQIPGGWMS